MKTRILGISLAGMLCACSEQDLHRLADVSQGTLVVGLGMPMREVMKRSTVKFGHRLALAGMSSGSYADGNAYFDLELAASGLRFHGCSRYSIDFEGPDETVTLVSVCLTPDHSRWSAYTRELRETAAKLKGDGWVPQVERGQPSLESFMARDGSSIGTTDSGVVAVFEWRKRGSRLALSANRAWDSARFWSMVDIVPAAAPEPTATPRELWLAGIPTYPGAKFVCKQHVTGTGENAVDVLWSMYATTDAPEQVAAFYTAATGNVVQLPGMPLIVTGDDPTTRLSVHPISDSSAECDAKPPADTRTVFILSQSSWHSEPGTGVH